MKTLLLSATLLAATGAVAAPGAPIAISPATPAGALSLYEEKREMAKERFEIDDFAGAQKNGEAALSFAQTPAEKLEALWLLGRALEEQKRYAEAREVWQKMLPLARNSPDDFYQARLGIASTYFNQKMWQPAADVLPALISNAPAGEKSALRLQLATAYWELQ